MGQNTDILVLLLGAGISFATSVGVLIVQRILDRSGRVVIFYKKIYSDVGNHHPWGIYKNQNGGLYFDIPMYIEIQNTSNTAKVIRDFSVYIYQGNEMIAKFVQIEFSKTAHSNGAQFTGEETYKYGDVGAYSFVIPPMSIAHYKCDFCLNSKGERKEFNNLRIGYYNEKDKIHICKIFETPDGWHSKGFQTDENWIRLD